MLASRYLVDVYGIGRRCWLGRASIREEGGDVPLASDPTDFELPDKYWSVIQSDPEIM